MKLEVVSLPEKSTLSKLGVPSLMAPRERVMFNLSVKLFAIIASSEVYCLMTILLPLNPGEYS